MKVSTTEGVIKMKANDEIVEPGASKAERKSNPIGEPINSGEIPNSLQNLDSRKRPGKKDEGLEETNFESYLDVASNHEDIQDSSELESRFSYTMTASSIQGDSTSPSKLRKLNALFKRTVSCNPCCCCCCGFCNLKRNCIAIVIYEMVISILFLAFGIGILQINFVGFMLGSMPGRASHRSINLGVWYFTRFNQDENHIQIPQGYRAVANSQLKTNYINSVQDYKQQVIFAGLSSTLAAFALFIGVVVRHNIACWIHTGLMILHIIFLWWSFAVYHIMVDRIIEGIGSTVVKSQANQRSFDNSSPRFDAYSNSARNAIIILAVVNLFLTIISFYFGLCSLNLGYQILKNLDKEPHEGKCSNRFNNNRDIE